MRDTSKHTEIASEPQGSAAIVLPDTGELQKQAWLAVSVVSLLWGTTWFVSKKGVMAMCAIEMAGIRQFMGGTCFLLFFLWKGVALPRWRDMGSLLLLSILNFMLSNGLSTWAVKHISSGLAAIIGSIFPLWLVVMGILFERTPMPRKAIAGLLVGFAGVCIIFYEHLTEFINPKFGFGIMLSLIATVTWAVGSYFTQKQKPRFNPYLGLGIQMMISGAVLYSFSLYESDYVPIGEIPSVSWISIVYLIVFGSIIAFSAYLFSLKHLPIAQASLYAYINPVIALLMGVFLLAEPLSPLILSGTFITLSGVYMVNRAYSIRKS